MKQQLYAVIRGARIERTFSFPANQEFPQELEPGAVKVPANVAPHTHYFSAQKGGVLPIPERPGRFATFDHAAGIWATDLDAARDVIDAERVRRAEAPILYRGRNLDADARAQKNISDKLAEIKAREDVGVEMPTALMVWRDADNRNEIFSSMAEMKAWLQGLVMAIAQRGTEAYLWAWAAKAAADRATTPQELEEIFA